MIYVDRSRVKAPAILSSEKAHNAYRDIKDFYSRPLTSRLQERPNFRPEIWKEAKPALIKLFNGKCAYCESKTDPRSLGEVDMFRPKGGSINSNGEFSPDHYWWLVYEWFNYYLACSFCNQYKASRFPVDGRRVKLPQGSRVKLGASWYLKDLIGEKPLILDPCAKDFDADKHLIFDGKTGQVAGLTKEGKTTIEVFELNRPHLLRARVQELSITLSLLSLKLFSPTVQPITPQDEIINLLKRAQEPAREFAGAQRQVIRRWFIEHVKQLGGIERIEKLGVLFKKKEDEGGPAALATQVHSKQVSKIVLTSAARRKARETRKTKRAGLNPQYITRIEIHNFRIIEDLVLKFPPLPEKDKSWIVLLGENGVGKSSVLKAVVLALMNSEFYSAAKLQAKKFLRVGTARGHVRVFMTGYSLPFEVNFDKKRFWKTNDNQLHTYLFGYGGTRLLPQSSHKPAAMKGVVRAENLFDPFLPLINAKTWMLSLKGRPFGYSALALKDLLVRENEDRLFRKQGEIKLKIADFGTSIPLEELSDGYQSIVALTADILKVMLETWPTAEKSQGIVLIDEIDVHLHPRWKVEIVSRLRRVFPRVQFIITTHDPLCLLGTRSGEVHVLHRNAETERVAVTQFDVPAGTTADQVLTGFWFGLPSTMDPGTVELMQKYYQLMRARRTPANKTRLRYMEAELGTRLRKVTATSIDRITQSVAAEIIKDDYLTWGPQKRKEARAEIKKGVLRRLKRRS